MSATGWGRLSIFPLTLMGDRITNVVRRNISAKIKSSVRAQAVLVLDAVLNEGRSLATALPEQLARSEIGDGRGLLQELCYGSLRWLPRLQALGGQLLEKPLKSRDRDVSYLILLGLYQLIFMRIPAHAAVDETVTVARQLGKPWACGLINSVLRNFQRRRDALEAGIDTDPQALYAHPDWLRDAIAMAWPEDWPDILMANQQRPPMTLRVNLSRVSRDEYLQQLLQRGLEALAHPLVCSAVVLTKPVDVQLLPGFVDGLVSVQDAAAQLAPGLLTVGSGQRILDACAAPGGKTGHLLESCSDIDVTAIDVDAGRLQRVADNLVRLGYRAKLICGDACRPDAWWDGRLFDRILLDAPCSATGVIRRHPDIKYLRQPDDIPALVAAQSKILTAMWRLLKPGGRLVYVTCSILPQENHVQLQQFLAVHGDADEIRLDVAWGRAMAVGRQILNSAVLPGHESLDGFYYAVITKQA